MGGGNWNEKFGEISGIGIEKGGCKGGSGLVKRGGLEGWMDRTKEE